MSEPIVTIQDTFSLEPPNLTFAKWINPLRERPVVNNGMLLVDRDGVINRDTNYLCKVDDLEISAWAAKVIGDARRLQMDVAIVTNQSGIGRGYYDWNAFQIVQDEIYQRLLTLDADAHISLVCACPFHADAIPPYNVKEHCWRKPNPGMLEFSMAVLQADPAKTSMIGDKQTDRVAAERCKVAFIKHEYLGSADSAASGPAE